MAVAAKPRKSRAQAADGPLKVSYRPTNQLVAYARNSRTHSADQVEQIAASIRAFGFTNPILIDEEAGIIAGHGRVLAAQKLGLEHVPTITIAGLTAAQKRAYVIADNKLALNAGWDAELLAAEILALKGETFDVSLLGFSDEEIADLLGKVRPPATEPDALPPIQPAVSRLGDLWVMGGHRLICGDTTNPAVVARVVGGARLAMLSSPYGMGKEADGIANDNLYDEKLDAFQMQWWRAWSGVLAENGSAYIWGNAPDLWRLWWSGGLRDEKPPLHARNEIVWDKQSGFGMASDGGHSYPPATERCLFLMRGEQFLGNQNKDQYWDGYEPLRKWLEEQRNAAGWSNGDVNKITRTSMAGHWFSQSQFHPISRSHYEALQNAANGSAFVEGYDELFQRLFPTLRAGGNAHRRELAAELRERRSYFDNSHDAMTDVWQFPRVVGAERFGHATPKPVAMISRCVKSSAAPGAAIGAPFAGTGTEFIACEMLGRSCVGAEIEPQYVDVVLRRWQDFTGQEAVLESTGETFAEVAAERSSQTAAA